MSWAKEVIAAFLMDDPSKDVDPKRASKRSEVAMRKAFSVKPLISKRSLTTWSKRLENAEYDLERLGRQVGEPDGYTWADVGYGDMFDCVRGDTILDLALRNNKSVILVDCLRSMGAPASNLGDLNDWQLECSERLKEFGTFEGILFMIPPHLQRIAGDDPLAPHGLWQKRHFVFYPMDNSFEALTPLVPRLSQPELRMNPSYAALSPHVVEKKRSQTPQSGLRSGADDCGNGSGGVSSSSNSNGQKRKEFEGHLVKEVVVLRESSPSPRDLEIDLETSDDFGGQVTNREVVSMKKYNDTDFGDRGDEKFVFEVCFEEDESGTASRPVIVAASSHQMRSEWMRVINKDKKNVPRVSTWKDNHHSENITVHVHTG